jgi:hypothetical protein
MFVFSPIFQTFINILIAILLYCFFAVYFKAYPILMNVLTPFAWSDLIFIIAMFIVVYIGFIFLKDQFVSAYIGQAVFLLTMIIVIKGIITVVLKKGLRMMREFLLEHDIDKDIYLLFMKATGFDVDSEEEKINDIVTSLDAQTALETLKNSLYDLHSNDTVSLADLKLSHQIGNRSLWIKLYEQYVSTPQTIDSFALTIVDDDKTVATYKKLTMQLMMYNKLIEYLKNTFRDLYNLAFTYINPIQLNLNDADDNDGLPEAISIFLKLLHALEPNSDENGNLSFAKNQDSSVEDGMKFPRFVTTAFSLIVQNLSAVLQAFGPSELLMICTLTYLLATFVQVISKQIPNNMSFNIFALLVLILSITLMFIMLNLIDHFELSIVTASRAELEIILGFGIIFSFTVAYVVCVIYKTYFAVKTKRIKGIFRNQMVLLLFVFVIVCEFCFTFLPNLVRKVLFGIVVSMLAIILLETIQSIRKRGFFKQS